MIEQPEEKERTRAEEINTPERNKINMHYKIGMLRMISLPVIFGLLFGCASYETLKKQDTSDDGFKEIIISEDSITVHYFPYIDSILCKKHLGIKPSRAQMIPSLLKIENNSTKIIKVNIEKCTLNISDEKCSPLELEDAINRARRSGAEVVAWQVGFGLIGWSIAANNVTSTNRSLEEDYHSKYFKPTLINSGKTAQGIIFNQLPSVKSYRNGNFNLNITDLSSQNTINMNISIPDSILTIRRSK